MIIKSCVLFLVCFCGQWGMVEKSIGKNSSPTWTTDKGLKRVYKTRTILTLQASFV